MNDTPVVAVLKGGVSPEREVSLVSGEAAAAALSKLFDVEIFDVVEAALPKGLESKRHVVFNTLHGVFGEDGQVQSLLENAGFVYAGCDAASSELTFDKTETKDVLANAGLAVLEDVRFDRRRIPDSKAVVERLGTDLVLKPNRQGSSIGLRFIESEEELRRALEDLVFEDWLIEPLVVGKEVSIGVLNGAACEIVELRPKSGRYDYESKYTKGQTEYLAPAPLDEELSGRIKKMAVEAYTTCDCRDFVRVDLMIDARACPWILEINTLPGLTETSLLPMSAKAMGLNYEKLLRKLVEPAFSRFSKEYSIC